MSGAVIHHSPLRKRAYVRRFDHDEAKRRFAAGETQVALASEYGVTVAAIDYAINDRRARQVETNRRWRTGECETCGAPAMRLVGSKAINTPDGRVLCAKCRSLEKRERLRFDNSGTLIAVRCTHVECVNGERWQPPRNFPKGTRFKDVREGGIHGFCRACNTRLRKQYRDARKVPCSHGCGTLVHSERADPNKPPECLPCVHRRNTGRPRAVTREAVSPLKEKAS